jgi:excisionase family DNA binding protein
MHEPVNQLAYSPQEAARVAGLSRGSIFKALREKRLSARKAGTRTLILRADLEAYLADLPARESVAA